MTGRDAASWRLEKSPLKLRSCVAVQERRLSATDEGLAHDILAAEAFAMPAPEPRLHPELLLPDDPAEILGPHDILAAEEFAMPAPDAGPRGQAVRQATAPGRPRWAGLAGAGLLAYWVGRRRR
jgi:hypothetical protein